MIQFERGHVVSERDTWPGVQRLWVQLTDTGEQVSAVSYLQITGLLSNGDAVVLNTNALRRGLGTGGDAYVVAVDSHNQDLNPAMPEGHMMKARYTPLQLMVDAVDDPASTHHSSVDECDSLKGLPVVIADLHSSLAPIVAGITLEDPHARVVYVHTDWAALPVAYSRLNARLRDEGLVACTISAGQSFGGDREAVSTPSALAAARAVENADVVVATQGPGNLGTGTTWGYSGIAASEVVHQVAAMDGEPFLALRVSNSDPRPRHRGLSHHSSTVLDRMALASATLAVPAGSNDVVDREVAASLSGINERRRERGRDEHRVIPTDPSDLRDAIASLPVTVSTMGRGLDDDYKAFEYAALAGRLAGITSRRRRSRISAPTR